MAAPAKVPAASVVRISRSSRMVRRGYPAGCVSSPCRYQPLRQHQVQVGAFDELLGLDSELIHELACFVDALFRRFIVHQRDFELEKMTETFDAVQVNAG